jgi:signal transduction histidine kinase
VTLVPKNETIHLHETIQLPLQCVKDLQSKHTISLKSIAADVATHIITDKLWLQENILCLFSNAVKYSNGGTITLEITLAKESLRGGHFGAWQVGEPEPVSSSKSWLALFKKIRRRTRTTILPSTKGEVEFGYDDDKIFQATKDVRNVNISPIEKPAHLRIRVSAIIYFA